MRNKHSRGCDPCKETVDCDCYKEAKKEFFKWAEKSENWLKIESADSPYKIESKKCDWKKVEFPAGLDDLKKFSESNSHVHVTAFLIDGNNMSIIYSDKKTRNHKEFIHIAYSESISRKTKELTGHWWPIVNISKCSQRIYLAADMNGELRPKTRFKEETCEFCLKRMSLTHATYIKKGVDIDPNNSKIGLLEYRDR